MADVKLLPCPFCGCDRAVPDVYIRDGREVACPECGAGVPAYNPVGKSKSIAKWNTRALTPKQAAADEMFEALEEIWKYAAHGTATKQKDARGRQFAAIHDLARAAISKAGQP